MGVRLGGLARRAGPRRASAEAVRVDALRKLRREVGFCDMSKRSPVTNENDIHRMRVVQVLSVLRTN